ncbi:MAG: DUF192 domain-containing protein [Candidatus Aenigmarchaeota archaeon]|nr:DUF192 domain-containing protein [Candidatus Aenigmarchaeota archaeon]
MANYLIGGLVAIILISFVMLAIGKFQAQKFVTVKIGNATVNAELADTEAKQIRGLMFRDSLAKDGGMLFDFKRDGRHGIWMMNMSMPIDIVWLDGDKRVVSVEENAPPCGALLICKSYSPESNDRYVLEVAAGYAKKHGIRKGTKASFDIGG